MVEAEWANDVSVVFVVFYCAITIRVDRVSVANGCIYVAPRDNDVIVSVQSIV
jgi:hypothetical protein